MKILNLISPSDVRRLEGQVAEMSQIDAPGYLQYFADEVDDVTFVASCTEDNFDDVHSAVSAIGTVTHVVLRHFNPDMKGLRRFIHCMVDHGHTIIVVLSDFKHYKVAQEWPVEIAIPPSDQNKDGVTRFKRVYDLVTKNRWNSKARHWFWELTNPAEISAYKESFTAGIFQSLVGAISYRCYIDSYFGIRYSPTIGIPSPPLMLVPDKYTWPIQDVLYHLNVDQMRGFANGTAGTEIQEKFLKEMR